MLLRFCRGGPTVSEFGISVREPLRAIQEVWMSGESVDTRTQDVFLPVDLHVHTPASWDYKGKKSEEGYKELLRVFQDAGVRIIAITDHNTLDGYREIIRLREEVNAKAAFVAELAAAHPTMDEQLALIQKDVALFESILILPGVELDAKPGIHVLAIFDPEQPLETAEQLIVEAGFATEFQGREDKDSRSALVVDELLDAIARAGGLAILAHVDRDKGAYKDLQGSYRARVFTSDSLAAVSYADPVSEAQLSDLLAQKEYRRSRPLAMFRCSDYHGETGPPKKVTFMQLDSVDFAGFKQVIENPIGRVSQTEDPEIRSIIEEVARSKSSIALPTIAALRESGASGACALLNQWGGGQLVVGTRLSNGNLSITGVADARTEIDRHVDSVLQGLNPVPSRRILYFDWNDRVVAIVTLGAIGVGRLHVLQEVREAWIISDGKPKSADAPEIAQMVEENVIRRLADIQRQPIAEAKRFASQTPILAQGGKYFRLARKIEERSQSTFRDRVRGEFLSQVGNLSTLKEDAATTRANGLASGSCGLVVDGPYRYSHAYMRLSLPMFQLTDFEEVPLKGMVKKGPFLVIAHGGAVYYQPGGKKCTLYVASREETPAVLKGIGESEGTHLARLALWLKSAPAIAYSLMAADDSQGRAESAASLYARLPVPEALFSSEGENLAEIAEAILQLEHDFLARPPAESQSDYLDTVEAHNLAVDAYAYEAEAVIASLLGLDEDDALALDDFLRSRRLYALDGVDAISGRAIQAPRL